MTLGLDEAQPTVNGLLDAGLTAVDETLQSEFDSDNPDQALILALNSLRSRYVFDKMRVTRAQITAIDDAPDTIAILSDLGDACDSLEGIQKTNTATTDWINKAANAVDTVFGIFSKLAKL
jgi:hypothetical protein